MKIENVPFTIIDWRKAAPVEHKGDSGTSIWQTIEKGNIRMRMIQYSPGFKSDHYCERGHIALVLEGELLIKLKNGSEHKLQSGNSFQTADDVENPHLVWSDIGAKVFIVD